MFLLLLLLLLLLLTTAFGMQILFSRSNQFAFISVENEVGGTVVVWVSKQHQIEISVQHILNWETLVSWKGHKSSLAIYVRCIHNASGLIHLGSQHFPIPSLSFFFPHVQKGKNVIMLRER